MVLTTMFIISQPGLSAYEPIRPRLNTSAAQTPSRLAADIDVPPSRINALVHWCMASAILQPTLRCVALAEVIETQVVIRIIDTGIGIPATMLSKIFDLFTQVDGVAERSKSGLGVGLAISRKLAEMHEGCIEVESLGEERGAVFTLRLPVATSRVP